MSFVTFSQRTTLSAASDIHSRARRVSQVPAHRIMAAIQEILERILWDGQRQNGIQSARADLRECRIFHKYMRKSGIRIPVRKSKQRLACFVSFFREKASQLRGIEERSGPSKLNPIGPYIPESKSRARHASLGVPTYTCPDTPGILESSRRATDRLLSNSTAHSTLSMSSRRHAANIPTLQHHLSFNVPQFLPTNKSSGDHPLENLFLIDPCSTPITPRDKIIHTPPYPPSLRRPDMKKTPFDTPVEILEGSAPHLCSTSRYFTLGSALFKVSENIRRRLSVVSPPEARPIHAPRRLSYSHTYGKAKSPLKRRGPASTELLDSCAETLDLLASPLVIMTSSSNRQLESTGWIDNNGCEADFSFYLRGSPIAVKV